MKRILLTGATGFLGSFLLKRLIADGYDTVVLKRSTSNDHRVAKELKKVKSYNVDLIPIDDIFQENRSFDLILHTATNYGMDGVPLSTVLQDNVIFPLTLAETAVQYGCNTFINTDSFFGKESLSYQYLAYYTFSKKASIDALKVANVHLINCRLEHVYGPGDNANKFVTSIITQLLANKPSIDLTDGKQKRDFVFVDDVIDAFACIISHVDDLPKFTEVEVGTGYATSIFDFVSTVKNALPHSQTFLNWGILPRRIGEFEESKANLSVLSMLGWKPAIMLDDGISRVINYYQTHGI